MKTFSNPSATANRWLIFHMACGKSLRTAYKVQKPVKIILDVPCCTSRKLVI